MGQHAELSSFSPSPGEAKISRRLFIKTAALTSISTWVWGWQEALSKSGRGSVIVVGAGMSGVSAARELQSKGFHVTVLEGRSRLGGRIWSNRSLGAAVDLGASWIHETDGNPVTDLAKKFGAKMKVTDFDDLETYDFDGKEISEEEAEAFEEVFKEIMEGVEKLENSQDEDISVGAVIEKVLKKHKLTQRQRRILHAQLAGMETEAAEDLEKLSLLADEDEGFDGGDVLFPGGYDQLINGLARGLTILLKHPVKAIDYSGKKVKVATAQKTFESDFVVVTVPLGVLKSGDIAVKTYTGCMDPCHSASAKTPSNAIRFSPGLPDAKKKAIRRLGMGVLNKAALKFQVDPKDWPVESHFVSYASKSRYDYMEFLNMNKYGSGPILVAFTGGSFARSIEDEPDSKIVKDIMKILRTIYGKDVPNPSSHVVTRWMKDSFAGGSYSYVRVGSTFKDYDAIMQPLKNRVFFAGESTIKQYPGTVHGALLSGLREARRIAKL